MAPPVTPSPHRFLPSSSAKGPGRQLPPSSLRKQPDLASQQFRPTPRFAEQSDASNHVESIDSPGSSPLITQEHRISRHAGRAADQQRRELLDAAHDPDIASSGDELHHVNTAQKRKRQSPSPSRSARPEVREPRDLIVLSSSPLAERSPFASPVISRAHHEPLLERESGVTAPRFRLPGDKPPETPATSRIGDPAAPLLRTSRPGFVLPPRDEAPNILPDVFSPHKKGSKVFEQGGMANTVRDWILGLETKHTRNVLEDSSRRRKLRPEKGHKVIVEHVTGAGTGVWTVHAQEGECWLLIGPQGLGGKASRPVCEKSLITVRPPTWSVQLDGRKWGVAIAWSLADTV